MIVGRTLHRSLLLGLVLAGLEPVWVQPEVDAALGVPRAVEPEALAEASRPGARTRRRCSSGTRRTSAPWATWRGWRRWPTATAYRSWWTRPGPPTSASTRRCPPHALAQGADALVTSAHKTLPAWSQGALVLARTERIDPARFAAASTRPHTTSPSGTMLASIDAARALLARDGPALLGRLVTAVARLRARLRRVAGAGRARRPAASTR